MLICKFGNAREKDVVSAFPNMPNDFLFFLKKYNGGETPESYFSIGGINSDIVAFYGLGEVKYSFDSVSTIEANGKTYLPIAFDSYGNLIAISFDDGTIHFIDHENEMNPLRLADDFKSFLNKVESKSIDPKHLKSIEDREAELIRRGRGAIITDALRNLWRQEIEKYSAFHQEVVEV